MTRFVALIRGVNVGGKRMSMAQLKRGLESLGLNDVETYVQSGNAVFCAEDADPHPLAAEIEEHIAGDFGYRAQVLVLSGIEMARIASFNPFLDKPDADERRLHVTVLFEPPAASALEELALPIQSGEGVVLAGRALYLYLPHGYGRSKLSNSFFERALKTPATTRNWRTISALARLVADREAKA